MGKDCCCRYHDDGSSWQLKLQMEVLLLAVGGHQSAWWQEVFVGSDTGEGGGVGEPVGRGLQECPQGTAEMGKALQDHIGRAIGGV